MASVDELKNTIAQAVDGMARELEALSLKIHANPELGFKEEKAAAWLTEFLASKGLKVEKGIGGLATAFRATIDMGKPGPTIAILAEYDALPEIGHACGHNVIACSAVGAGAALAAIKETLPAGRVVVMGTPAEEGGGGKIHLLNQGTFKDVDAAVMIHPSSQTRFTRPSLGVIHADVEFYGQAAHASATPWKGINALDAMIQLYQNIGALRQQLKDDVRIHGIITDGGQAANIIPEHTAARFLVRSSDLAYLREVFARFEACVEGAARATGCTSKVTPGELIYEPMKPNGVLASLYGENWGRNGGQEDPADPEVGYGSTDMGNVTQVIPGIHPYVRIAPRGTPGHSRAMVAASKSPEAIEGIRMAAKTMAMTTLDLLASPQALEQARREFHSTK
jgi:amidohydrolase